MVWLDLQLKGKRPDYEEFIRMERCNVKKLKVRM